MARSFPQASTRRVSGTPVNAGPKVCPTLLAPRQTLAYIRIVTGNPAQELGKTSPRRAKVPPHISLRHVRVVAGLTIDELISRLEQETRRRYTRGALSAVENGHRGASAELINALEVVYGLPTGAIDTDYTPRHEANHRSES